MPEISPHALRMPRSGIREVMDVAWSMDGPVIGLHVGEPSFATPSHVLDGARHALDTGQTRYVSNAGIPPLRAALAAKVSERNGLPAGPENVTVTNGGMGALYAALGATTKAGDEVLVPDPGWPNFAMAIELLQAKPVGYPLKPENGFLPEIEDIAAQVTDRTRAVVVNFPSNPLGAVLPAALAEQLCRFADEHDLWLISDECYDQITFGAEHVSPGRWDEQDRVLSCFSFSKTYAMTGLRVGYLVAPEPVAETASKMQEPLIACVNAPAQHAALAALEGPAGDRRRDARRLPRAPRPGRRAARPRGRGLPAAPRRVLPVGRRARPQRRRRRGVVAGPAPRTRRGRRAGDRVRARGRGLDPLLARHRHRRPARGIGENRGMRQRVSVITLGVRDLARARAFYEAMGWESGAAPADDVVFFQAGDLVLALWDRARLAEDSCVEDGGGWGGVTPALNLGSPGDVDAVIEEARAAGATIGREPAETFWGGYSAVFIDPDGHPWEIAHNPHWTLTEDGGVRLN